METNNFTCPCCGAAITFDSDQQELVCKNCGNKFTIDQLKEIKDVNEATSQTKMNWDNYDEENAKVIDNLKTYNCKSCGAEVVGDENTAATVCPYCGNPMVISDRLSGIYQPDVIIPFKLDKKRAKEELQKFYKGKLLLPNAFKTENHLDKLTGVYVPFWLYDCHADVDMSFDATRTHSWSDSNYVYTQTDHYLVYRAGNMEFSDIPVDSSTKMDDTYMQAIEPYDYDAMVDFNNTYLAGFLADKYDVSPNDSQPTATKRVSNSAERTIARTVVGYSSVLPRSEKIDIDHSKIKYALLPVYMLNTTYQGKKYTFAMNGQTGKFVGSLPTDKGKFWVFLLGAFAAVEIIGQIFVFLVK